MPWISCVTVSIGSVHLFTESTRFSLFKTTMGIYWYSTLVNVNGRRERVHVEWYGNDNSQAQKLCIDVLQFRLVLVC